MDRKTQRDTESDHGTSDQEVALPLPTATALVEQSTSLPHPSSSIETSMSSSSAVESRSTKIASPCRASALGESLSPILNISDCQAALPEPDTKRARIEKSILAYLKTREGFESLANAMEERLKDPKAQSESSSLPMAVKSSPLDTGDVPGPGCTETSCASAASQCDSRKGKTGHLHPNHSHNHVSHQCSFSAHEQAVQAQRLKVAEAQALTLKQHELLLNGTSRSESLHASVDAKPAFDLSNVTLNNSSCDFVSFSQGNQAPNLPYMCSQQTSSTAGSAAACKHVSSSPSMPGLSTPFGPEFDVMNLEERKIWLTLFQNQTNNAGGQNSYGTFNSGNHGNGSNSAQHLPMMNTQASSTNSYSHGLMANGQGIGYMGMQQTQQQQLHQQQHLLQQQGAMVTRTAPATYQWPVPPQQPYAFPQPQQAMTPSLIPGIGSAAGGGIYGPSPPLFYNPSHRLQGQAVPGTPQIIKPAPIAPAPPMKNAKPAVVPPPILTNAMAISSHKRPFDEYQQSTSSESYLDNINPVFSESTSEYLDTQALKNDFFIGGNASPSNSSLLSSDLDDIFFNQF